MDAPSNRVETTRSTCGLLPVERGVPPRNPCGDHVCKRREKEDARASSTPTQPAGGWDVVVGYWESLGVPLEDV
jgi:hypothetical protein